ncbi:MAG: autotransporter-associated beta strand repeat-containing protein, partial [Chthoniobacteraceae bacterium]
MKRVSLRKLRRRQSAPSIVRSRRPRPLGVSLARFTSALAVAGALFAGVGSAQAATFYWDQDNVSINNVLTGGGLGGLGTWSAAGPLQWWSGSGLAPSTLLAWNNGNDTAVFTGTAGTVTLGSAVTVGGLQFNTTGYTLGVAGNTNAITFGVNSNIVLNNIAAATINGSLAGSSNVSLTGGAFGGVTAGTLNLTGTGASLTGYTGSTTINNGMTMALSQNSQALSGTTGSITLNGGGILLTNTSNAEAALTRVNATTAITSNNGAFTVTNAAAETSALTSIGVLTANSGRTQLVSTTALTAGTQTLTLATGSLAPTGTGTLAVGMGGYTAGTVSALNSIVVTGAATTTNTIIGPWATVGTTGTAQTDYATYGFSGGTMNAATGATTGGAATAAGITGANITAVTAFPTASVYSTTANMTLSAVANLTANTNLNTLRYTGAAGTVAGAFTLGTFGVLQAGSGTLTLNPTAVTLPTAAPGNVYLTTGTAFGITVSAPVNNNGANALTLVLSGQNTVVLSSATSSYSGGTVLNSGTLSIAATANIGTGGLTFNGSGTLTLTAAIGSPFFNRNITLANGSIATISNSTFANTFAGNITGTGGLNFTPSTGNVTVQTGTNTFTGPVTINPSGAANVIAASTSALGNVNNPLIMGSTATTGGLALNSSITVGSLSGGAATGGGINLSNSGTNTLTVGGNNENSTYAGVISGTSGQLTKTGTGTLTLTGTNTFTGAANLNGGLVNITALANLGGGTTITYNGGGIQFTAPGVDVSTRTNTFSAGGATFDTNGNQIYFANAVGSAGAGGLTKSGVGTLFLQGSNTYTGTTTVSGGVLNLQNAGALGTGAAAVTVNTGAAIALQHATGANFGSKALTLNGDGSVFGQNGALVNVTGANTYGGTITLGSSSTISADNASTLNLTSTGNITGTGFGITLGGTGTGTLAGSLQTGVGGSLTKTGTGTWTVSGATGNYDGGTTINGGKLIVDLTTNPTGVLSPTSALNINGSDVTVNGPGNQTVASLNLGAGVSTNIAIIPNGGTTTLAITGPGWTRGAGAVALFDYSSVTSGSRTATVSNIPTGTGGATGTNNILGYADVKDSGGVTGLAYVDGSNNISRFDSATLATVLADNSDSATTDYTTLGMASNPLLWSNAITTRSVNSLTLDPSAGSQTVHMGAVGNVLTLTSNAIQKINANDATLLGGQIGANNSEVIVHQNGTGTLFLNSPISSGTGALSKLGSGTLQVSGGIVTAIGTLNGTSTVTVPDGSILAVGQAVTGGGIPAGTTITGISGNTLTLSTAATANMSSPLTFGTGSTYTGATIIDGGTVKAGASSQFTAATVGSTNNAGYVTSTGGPLGIGSAVTLANVSGAALDLNGYNVAIGSISGGGASGGNLLLSNGGTLTVGGGNLINNLSTPTTSTTFGGLVSGTGNLTVTGGGGLTLTNTANTFSGQVNVNSGTLVVSGNLPVNTNSALGNGNTPIVVNGVASGQINSGGLPGGTLLVQGGLGATGVTVGRSLSLSGRGNNNANGAAFLNIGNNTYNGIINTSNNSETRVGSIAGTMTLGNAGALYLGTATGSFYTTPGAGNIVLNGIVSGGALNTVGLYMGQAGVLNKTLVINNYSNNQIGDIRADGGTVRVANGAAFGAATAAGNISKLRGNNTAGFEIRTDAPTSFSNISGSGTDTQIGFYLDRAAGGAGLGTQVQNATTGALSYASASGNITFGEMLIGTGGSRTFTFAGRDGYGATWGSGSDGLFNTATNGSPTLVNNSNGLLTVDGSIAVSSDGTARSFTVTGAGDLVVNGTVRQGGGTGPATFVKGPVTGPPAYSGQGTLVMNNTPTVVVGDSSVVVSPQINAGTILLTGANATITRTLGAAGLILNNGALDYRGPGETYTKTLNQGGTTGNAIILANQGNANALIFNTSAVGNAQAGAKTLYLGGASTAANEIGGVITGAGSLAKVGSGTWLYDPATTTYTAGQAAAAFTGGAANTNTITVASTTGIGIGATVNTAGNIPAGAVVTAINGLVITISHNIGTTLTGTVGFGATTNFTGGVTVSGGTLQVKPTANAAAGASGGNLFATTQALTFANDALTNNGFAGGTFQVNAFGTMNALQSQTMGALTPTAGHGRLVVDAGTGGFVNNLNFASLGTRGPGATLNFAPASTTLSSITFTAAPTGVAGQIGGFAYITNPTTGAIDFVTNATTPAALAAPTGALPATGGSSTGNYSVASGTTTFTTPSVAANTVRLLGGANIAQATFPLIITNTSAVATGGIMFDNSTGGSATISGGNIQGTVAAQELIFIVGGNTPASTLTVNSTIGAGAASIFTKAGNGTMILGGANTFTGNAFVNEGIVQLAGTTTATVGSPAAGSTFTLRQGATLDINNSGASVAPYTGATALRTTNIGALTGAGSITNGLSGTPSAAAISIGVAATNVAGVFSGIISDGTSGTGGMTVIRNGASGAVALTGLNTYTGPTILSGGATLTANVLASGGTASSIGQSTNAAGNLVFNGGTLRYEGASATVYSATQTPSVSIDRLFTLAGNGTIDSSGSFGSQQFNVTNAANSAALVFNGTSGTGGVTGTDAVALAGNAGARTLTLTGSSAGDNAINLKIADQVSPAITIAVTKTGAGHWVLGNVNNTYTGATTITQGQLVAQDTGANATSATTLAAGTATTDFYVNSTNGLSVGQAVTGAGISGTPTIAAVLDGTHVRLSTAQTLASSAALTFGSINSLSSSNLVFNQGTAGTEAILESVGTFSRAIGTGTNQVQWGNNQSGGFAASSSPLAVNLGSGATITMGAANSPGQGTGELQLNSTTALSDVTLTNPLNLNGAVRTIRVLENTTTNTDYATVSGIISGGTGSGLIKQGAGVLYLTGANTYSGNTTLSAGTTIVTSIGGGSTTSSAFGDGSGILALGGGTLIYAGTGETTTRQINLNANTTIDASGSGALVLSNFVNNVAGTRSLTLRGYSNDANQITAALADNGGALTISKQDGGTWIINGASTFSGGINNAGGGFLGISGASTAFTGTIIANNGAIFATNPGGLTIGNAFTITNNTPLAFTGTNSITTSGLISGATGNPWDISNAIVGGTLTLNGNFNNNETATSRTLTIRGPGNTNWNGIITSGGGNAAPTPLNFNTSGAVTIGGTTASTVAQTQTIITQGRIINSRAGNLNPFGAATNGVLSMAGGSLESTVAVTGANALINTLQLTNVYGVITGTNSIEFVGNATNGSFENNGGGRRLTNNITGPASLTFSTNTFDLSDNSTAQTATLAGTGTYNINVPITSGGTGASVLTYQGHGTGALNLTGTNTFTGAANFQGGTTTISGSAGNVSNGNATAAITTANSAVLTLNNATAFAGNRLNNKPLTLTGATLNFIGNAAGTTEGTAANTTSTLTAGIGQSTINITNNGGTTQLNFASLALTAAGGALDFTSNAQLGTATNQVAFTTLPTLSPATATNNPTGIIARATVSGAAAASGAPEFATYNTTGLAANTLGVQAFNAYNVPTLSSTTTVGNTVTVASTAGLTVGMAVYGGNGVGANTIASITGPSTFTLTNPATTAGATPLTYGTTAYTSINSPLIAASTDTIKLGTGFITVDDINANRSFNAINIAGSGINLDSTCPNAQLTITSGGVIVSGGSNTISVDRIALGAEGFLSIATGSSLNITGAITSATGGVDKNLGGDLTFSAQQFYSVPTVVNAGKLTLAGGTNTLFFNNTLAVNNGATLDLNGNTQYVGSFTS